MKTSANGRQLIESFEGCILTAYDDYNDQIIQPGQNCRGTLTIGYGHTTDAGLPAVHVGQTISKERADEILSDDLTKVEENVTLLVKVPINQNEFDALVSFQFNTGALGRSSALLYLNHGDYSTAADLLTLYNKAGGRVLPGLVRRRQAEKKLFLTPITTKEIKHDINTSTSWIGWVLDLLRRYVLSR